MRERDICIAFLEQNGWKADTQTDPFEEYHTYYKEAYYSIDIDSEEIVIVAGVGDIAHLAINYYTLIGWLIEHRQIGCNYLSMYG